MKNNEVQLKVKENGPQPDVVVIKSTQTSMLTSILTLLQVGLRGLPPIAHAAWVKNKIVLWKKEIFEKNNF